MTELASQARVLVDVGGTHARLAWQARAGGPLTHVRVWEVASHDSLEAVLRVYLQEIGAGTPAAMGVAVAAPVLGDQVAMINHPWSFSQRALQAAMGLHHLCVINDFSALARALPFLGGHERRLVGGQADADRGVLGVLGPGTGLGVSGLMPLPDGRWQALAGEGGHVTLPAETVRERVVMEGLQQRYGHASAERLLCGQGLLDTWTLLAAADAAPMPLLQTPADVTSAALAGGHPLATEAVSMFCALLGSVAGNLALTLGARGGIYVGGGIVPRLGGFFDASDFRRRFEAKGRYRDYLVNIPTWVITTPVSPALAGVAQALDDSLGR